MQALFYIVFFGVIYALIGFVTFGATETTAELTQRHLQSVKKLFEDVEYAVNENHLRENVDILDLLDDDGLLDLTAIAPYVSWSPKELTESPWKTEYRVCQREVIAPTSTEAFSGSLTSEQRSTLLYADEYGYMAANVYEFVLLSTGPNRQFDLASVCTFGAGATVGTYTDLATVIQSIGATDTDDIVHIFSTRKPLQRIADAYVVAEQKAIEAIYNGYAQRFIEVTSDTLAGGYKDFTDKENEVVGSNIYNALNTADYSGCYQQYQATYCADASSNWSQLLRAAANGYDDLCTIADPATLSLSTAMMFCYTSDNQITSATGDSAFLPKPDIRGFENTKDIALRSKYNFDVEEICSNPFGNGCNVDTFNFINLDVLYPTYATGGGHPAQGDPINSDLHPMFRTVMQFTGGGAADWQIYREVYIDALNAIE